MTISLKQGLLLKSHDGEYVYNIFSYNPNEPSMIVDILNSQLETLTSRKWQVKEFQEQIDAGTIVSYKDGELIGPPNE